MEPPSIEISIAVALAVNHALNKNPEKVKRKTRKNESTDVVEKRLTRYSGSEPREALYQDAKTLFKKGELLYNRRTIKFWKECISLQVRWLRQMDIQPEKSSANTGFVLNSWHLATTHFTYMRNSFSQDVQNLAYAYLSNCVKIYEVAIFHKIHGLRVILIDFIQSLLKKFMRNRTVMNESSLLWVNARNALRISIYHPTELETLFSVYSALVDQQQKFFLTWKRQAQKWEGSIGDTNLACYVVDQLSSLIESTNERIQQNRRRETYGILY